MYPRRFQSVIGCFVFFLLSLVVLTTCSDSNPLSPGDQTTALKYFPLEAGRSYTYDLDFTHNWGNHHYYQSLVHISGSCRLDIDQRLDKGSETFAKINVDFFIETDDDTSSGGGNGSNPTHSAEYFLLARGDSVWYVTGAPDFSHLDQGERELMMHKPGSGDSFLDLSLFEYLDWNLDLYTYPTETRGDTLVYINRFHYPGRRGTVKMTEADGFCYINCEKYLTDLGTAYFDNTTMTYTLVE